MQDQETQYVLKISESPAYPIRAHHGGELFSQRARGEGPSALGGKPVVGSRVS